MCVRKRFLNASVMIVVDDIMIRQYDDNDVIKLSHTRKGQSQRHNLQYYTTCRVEVPSNPRYIHSC